MIVGMQGTICRWGLCIPASENFHSIDTTPVKNVPDVRYEKFVPQTNLKYGFCCTPTVLLLTIVIPLRVYPVSQWVVTGLTVHTHVYCVST